MFIHQHTHSSLDIGAESQRMFCEQILCLRLSLRDAGWEDRGQDDPCDEQFSGSDTVDDWTSCPDSGEQEVCLNMMWSAGCQSCVFSAWLLRSGCSVHLGHIGAWTALA